jgi:conjugative relaxase-like TrwC/TraI family protein
MTQTRASRTRTVVRSLRIAESREPSRMAGLERVVAGVAQVTIKTGFDVDYYLDQVGMDYYLTAEGEPPGVWAGSAAAGLGLAGLVDAETMRDLYHQDIAPDGTLLGTAQKGPRYAAKRTYAQVQEAIDKRVRDELGELAPHMPDRVRKIRMEERAKTRTRTPYYDATFSAEKSISLAYAGLRAAAKSARDEGREQDAEQLEARARSVEVAVMAGADTMIAHVEQRAAIVRTGHHSASSGEFRDAGGFVAAKFLQHTSRSGDPQLHVQVPILNRAQRADGADERWRALDGRPLWAERLGASAYAGLAEAQELARQGFPLVKRPDGNGFEIGGIDQKTMDAFSARSADIAAKLAERIAEYEQMFGHPPNRQALYKLRKRVTVETRAPKRKPAAGKQDDREARAREAEEELAAWVRRASDEQVQALEGLSEAIEAYAAEQPGARPGELPSDAERAEVMRAAVAEVQRQNSAWTRAKLEWELYRQLPVLPARADWGQYLADMADDILTGRAEDVNVIQIAPVPDVVDVSRLGFRKDGVSVYRPPGEARYVTAGHLDLEEWLLSTSKAAAVQRVTAEAADTALAGTGLDLDQRAAAHGLLTSERAVSVLVAPAGTGKTYTMAQFARAWAEQTGARVIGLTMAENAARVMAGEGMSEAWNIARFFARAVPVRQGDVLVVDEASQVSTADLARIINRAYRAGARVILAGDTEQLGPVEAGGMFRLIAAEGERYQLAEVRRFTEGWERKASLQLRAGDMSAWAEYGTRGRVHEGPQDRVYDRAVGWWVTDIQNGKTSLLLAASNEEAARLAGLARERQIERGMIPGGREITLSDGNPAGRGDLVRARLNAEIDADGQRLANRDVIRITGWQGQGAAREAIAQRQLDEPSGDGRQWSEEFTVPAAYLEENAELAYAGNVYVAQGRTVDTAHLVVSEGMTRDLLYVGMTRGREENLAHVVTGPPDPADWTRAERDAYMQAQIMKKAALLEAGDEEAALKFSIVPPEPEGMRERAPWEAVIAAAMERDEPLGTAIEAMRAAADFPVNTRHLYEIAEAGWWKDVVPQIDDMVRQRISWVDYQRYLNDPERPAFLQELRAHEIGGRPIPDVLDAITARPLDGLRSVAAGLHGRLGKEAAPARGKTSGWAERTPQAGPAYVRDTYTALDSRQAELGEQLAASPPQWAIEAWGKPPAEPGALLDDWKQRAAVVQSYRELAGITDPAQAIGPAPARQAGTTEAFAASVRALELPDEAALLKAMGRGELEARVREYARAEAIAPPDVRREIDFADSERKYLTEQAGLYRTAGNTPAADSADATASTLGRHVGRLRVTEAARREWEEAAAGKAEAARQARAELDRRGSARWDDARPQPAAERATQAASLVEAARQRQVQQQREAESRQRNQGGILPEAQPERETPSMDPAVWAEFKAAQTARVEAGKAARREAMTSAVPVTGAEMDRNARELDRLDPEAIAVISSIEGNLARAKAGAERLADKRARDRADVDQAGIDEPVTQAEAQAGLEAAAAADRAEADYDAGIEI